MQWVQWILFLTAALIAALVVKDQLSARRTLKEQKDKARTYRIPLSREAALEKIADRRQEDSIRASLREEEGEWKFFCSTNEPYKFNRESVRFDVTLSDTEEESILILSNPQSLIKQNRNAVYPILARLDEYFISKLEAVRIE